MTNITKSVDFKNLSDLSNKLSDVCVYFYKVKNRFYAINTYKREFKAICEIKSENLRFFTNCKECLLFQTSDSLESKGFRFLGRAFCRVDLQDDEYTQCELDSRNAFLLDSINCINEMENIESNPLTEYAENIESNNMQSPPPTKQNTNSKALRQKVKRKALKKEIISKMQQKLHTKYANDEKREKRLMKKRKFKDDKRAYLRQLQQLKRQKILKLRQIAFEKELQRILDNENLSKKEAFKKAQSNINLAILLRKIA